MYDVAIRFRSGVGNEVDCRDSGRPYDGDAGFVHRERASKSSIDIAFGVPAAERAAEGDDGIGDTDRVANRDDPPAEAAAAGEGSELVDDAIA